jgi:hypothetical protein
MKTNDSILNLKEGLNIDVELEHIWSDYYSENDNPFSPLYQIELRKNAVTFLSLNPSLQPKDRKKAKRGFYPENPYPLIDCEKQQAKYKFFQKFYDIGKEIKQWTVLDLLYERESNQKTLESRYEKRNVKIKDKEFLQRQIKLTFNILRVLEPKIVVVANATVDRLIHQNLSEINISHELPNESNNFIYRINGVPFITIESKFLGSRFHEHNNERRKKLIMEIERVLNHV